MVICLKTISQPESKAYNIVVRNNHDRKLDFAVPFGPRTVKVDRWIGRWSGCTQVTITNMTGNVATVQVEDNDWYIYISGTIEGGLVKHKVDGDRDFEIILTSDGQLHFQCLDGRNWSNDSGSLIAVTLLPFQN